MTDDRLNFTATYSEMADEELLDIARDSADLMESARTALQLELDKRGLKLESPAESTVDDTDWLLYCPTCNHTVKDPLTCGECTTVICRVCGTPLRMPDYLTNPSEDEDISGGTQ